MKIVKVPPPVNPPTLYNIEGLTASEIIILSTLISASKPITPTGKELKNKLLHSINTLVMKKTL